MEESFLFSSLISSLISWLIFTNCQNILIHIECQPASLEIQFTFRVRQLQGPCFSFSPQIFPNKVLKGTIMNQRGYKLAQDFKVHVAIPSRADLRMKQLNSTIFHSNNIAREPSISPNHLMSYLPFIPNPLF